MNREKTNIQETACLHPEIEKDMLKWLETRSHPAFLLIGQPGVGKTTLVYRICKIAKYWIQEFNASHTRTGSSFRQTILPLLIETGISKWIHPSTPNGRVVLLDEMDGLSQGEKGGFQELIDYIKSKRNFKLDCPLVLICNTIEGRSMQYLQKYCLVRYTQMPSKAAIEAWLSKSITDELYKIGDIRKVKQLSLYDMEMETRNIDNPYSDTHIAIKAAWFTLFNKWTERDELDLETKDANLAGLLFHQNLPLFIEKKGGFELYDTILELVRWSDRADFWAFFHQCWNLLPLSYRLKLKFPNIHLQNFEKPSVIPESSQLEYTHVLTKQSALFNAWKEMNRITDENKIPFRCAIQWASHQTGKTKDTLGLSVECINNGDNPNTATVPSTTTLPAKNTCDKKKKITKTKRIISVQPHRIQRC